MLSKHILKAKTMILKNLKIQILVGNSLKMCVGAGFEISSTLLNTSLPIYIIFLFFLSTQKTKKSEIEGGKYYTHNTHISTLK